MTKDEYEDFVLRYKGCGACFPMYHTLSRFEKMWFSAIQKDVAELEKENAELKQANEWHYVKDGDLPKENKLYFVVIKDNGLAIAYFNGLHWETRYNLGDFGHCVETVIAWKEIVLPKESV